MCKFDCLADARLLMGHAPGELAPLLPASAPSIWWCRSQARPREEERSRKAAEYQLQEHTSLSSTRTVVHSPGSSSDSDMQGRDTKLEQVFFLQGSAVFEDFQERTPGSPHQHACI